MKTILMQKKMLVIKDLVSSLSHKNKDNTESAMNASAVLIELIENEKTMELFLEKDAQPVSDMMELAIDPSNYSN